MTSGVMGTIIIGSDRVSAVEVKGSQVSVILS